MGGYFSSIQGTDKFASTKYTYITLIQFAFVNKMSICITLKLPWLIVVWACGWLCNCYTNHQPPPGVQLLNKLSTKMDQMIRNHQPLCPGGRPASNYSPTKKFAYQCWSCLMTPGFVIIIFISPLPGSCAVLWLVE